MKIISGYSGISCNDWNNCNCISYYRITNHAFVELAYANNF